MKQGSVLGRGGKMSEFNTNEEIGDWSEQADKLPAGGRGKPPPRLGRGKKEGAPSNGVFLELPPPDRSGLRGLSGNVIDEMFVVK